ncbi:MAG TPA: NAD(P)/FAD-dependent oxidoreductase, partial [Myxococcales bacterium]|nr:NAD(P)/FAD-dependent oxidoreductase [Myxococcales bacterium]
WRNHYERLHLHTSKGLSGLPFVPFPREAPRYPSRAEVIAYLEGYAARLAEPPKFGQRVTSVRREGEAWITATEGAQWRSPHVVFATGYTRKPLRPAWPGLDQFGGQLLHSSDYRTGVGFPGKRVLVIGFGNSGGEIAIDLCEHGAHPTLAVRSAVNIVPRDFLGIPILAWGIALSVLPTPVADAISRLVSLLVIGRAEKLGLRQLPYGPMAQIRGDRRIPLLDIGTVERIRRGQIAVMPGVESFTPGGARFANGEERAFDAVILATGYRPALAELLQAADGVLDDHGTPRESGCETLPGLYFCGFNVAPTGMLREIAREARRIARSIAASRR